jgi:hypothetical protein
MTVAEHVAYWQTLAESDLEVARRFLQRGEKVHDCLFFGPMSWKNYWYKLGTAEFTREDFLDSPVAQQEILKHGIAVK